MTTSVKTPLISFVVCCYNVSDYIDEMLNSVLKQKYKINGHEYSVKNSKDIEIILVEDCSTDDGKTLKKCKQYTEEVSNIKLVKQAQNDGLSAARNAGINNSNGKYISFPDPDDVVCAGIIEKYIDSILENDYDAIVAGLTEKHFDKDNNPILEKTILPNDCILNTTKEVAAESIKWEQKVIFGYAWNKLYKKSIIENNKILFKKDLLYIEDLLFNIEFFKNAKHSKSIDCPAITYNRRLKSSESITSTYVENYFELHYLRIEALYKYWSEFNVLNEHAKEILGALYLRYALSALWRNKDPKSNMSKKDQRIWLNNFYELEMTKKLLKSAKSDSFKNNLLFFAFKTKIKPAVMLEADVVDFVTKHMNKTLTKARQTR